MTGLLSLVCCAEFLVVLLLFPVCSSGSNMTSQPSPNSSEHVTPEISSSTYENTSFPNESITATPSATSTSKNTVTIASPIPTTSTRTSTVQPNCIEALLKPDFSPVKMVVGGLLVGCLILLISTLVLACKVCSLSKRLKALSSDDELWEGTGSEDKNKSEAKETTVLMSDITQTQDEMSNGAANEEGGKAKVDGQMAEEKEKEEEEKEGGGAAVGEEASATPAAAESSSSPKPQEEAANSEPSQAAAAPAEAPAAAPAATSSSEGKE